MKGYLDELERTFRLVRRSATLDRLRIVWTASRAWPAELNHVAHDLLTCVHEHYGTRVRLAHGAALGGDQLGQRFTHRARWQVQGYPVRRDEWQLHGGWAGHQRNARMIEAERPDLCIALIWQGSRGATGCRDNALARGVPTVTVDDHLALLPRVRAML